MKIHEILAIILVPLFLSGCGILYTNVRIPRAYRSATPSDVKADSTDPTVTGKGCLHSVLFLVAWGNTGYAGAVKNALKDNPDAVLYDVRSDAEAMSILGGLYSRTCTLVTGRVAKVK